LARKYEINNSIPFELMDNVLQVAQWLQVLKERLCSHYGREIYVIISSGYRCPKLNKKARGSSTSAHIRGFAADITATSITPYELMLFIKKYMKDYPVDQCILEYGEWVHVGLDEPIKMRVQYLEAYLRLNAFGKMKTKYKIFARDDKNLLRTS
jgi:hypothetical protein